MLFRSCPLMDKWVLSWKRLPSGLRRGIHFPGPAPIIREIRQRALQKTRSNPPGCSTSIYDCSTPGSNRIAGIFSPLKVDASRSSFLNHLFPWGPWGRSSVGRALAWHARGRRFDPDRLHQPPLAAVQVDRANHHHHQGVVSFGFYPQKRPHDWSAQTPPKRKRLPLGSDQDLAGRAISRTQGAPE